MSRSHIRACIKSYTYLMNTPNKHWPEVELIRFSAIKYVTKELDTRLIYRTNMTPNDILETFTDEIRYYKAIISEELPKSNDLIIFCESALDTLEELHFLYFDID